MQQKLFIQNKKNYLAYNNFRKNIFAELAPRDAETILYLLPWMLSVNDPAVPGYVPYLKKTIMVHGIATDRAIIGRESAFKNKFNIRRPGALLRSSHQVYPIQGIYTIGSAGTISQTGYSDCDIWICICRDDFDPQAREHLSQKLNLIKDWLDAHLKMPVYFFICDVEDIRNAQFGALDAESSGSAQRHVLKEEFYRTTILICGKIPLWWVSYDPSGDQDDETFCAQYGRGDLEDYDCIDMGAPASVQDDEYFGAALWQFNKALTHPLKSVIKMLLLEMLLAAPRERLLCRRFRDTILRTKQEADFWDPSMFTIKAILEHKKDTEPDAFAFIRQCCYLRNDVKFYSKKTTIKEKLAQEVFADFPLTPDEAYRLNAFAEWPLTEQLTFGEKMFRLLMDVYRNIKSHQQDTIGRLTERDMTIIGRKLAVSLEKKHDKLPTVYKPTAILNLPNMTFVHDGKSWQVVTSTDAAHPLITHTNVVCCIAWLVWNDLYRDLGIRMAPNPTPITLQEINNLGKRIREIFGTFDIAGVDFENFLEPEKVTKMLVIVSFERPGHLKDMNDFTILYSNHWGEFFSRRFNKPERLQAFIEAEGLKFRHVERHYYVQRNSLYYEKIIDRTKKLVTHLFANIGGMDK